MQQLIKSASSLSWALPLFGLQQVTNAFRRSADGTLGGDVVSACDALTRASIDHCGASIRQTFEAGDKLQREFVDLMFRLVPRGGGDISGLCDMTEATNPIQMMRRFAGGEQVAVPPQPGPSAVAQSAKSQPTTGHAPKAQAPDPELGWGPVQVRAPKVQASDPELGWGPVSRAA